MKFRLYLFYTAVFFSFTVTQHIKAQTTPDPGLPGIYSVDSAEYDLGDLAWKPPGYPYFVEVRGSVHYPHQLEDGPFPVLFFLHGRHSTCFKTSTPSMVNQDWPCNFGYESITSFRGYDYLAKQMASHGYIVISISCNSINASDNGVADYGMEGRGELVQHHMDLWNTWNTTGGGPFDTLFIGKLDMQNVGTMGHSRGGEGVVVNALYNRSLGSPYGIKAVISLAPVDFFREVLNDVAFMNVAPYCDGDVSDLQGVHYYDDARYPGTDDNTPKHSVLMMGANHNFYNTVWTPGEYIAGTSDDWDDWIGGGDPHCGMDAPGNKRLSPDEQQSAFNAYASAFFRYYIGGEKQFTPIVNADDIIPPASSTLDSSQVFVSYQAPDSMRTDINRTLTTANEDVNTLPGDVNTNSISNYYICGNGSIESDCGISGWSNKVPHESDYNGLSQQNMEWNSATDWYENEIPAGNSDFTARKYLQFRTAVNYSDSPDGEDLDFSVELTDTAGNTSVKKISDYSHVLYDPPGEEYWDLPKVLFNTVKIPVRDFDGINLRQISSVKFIFDQSEDGSILITDLALSGGRPDKPFDTIGLPASVEDYFDSQVFVYPNPAGDHITVDLGNISLSHLTIFLSDMQGKLVMQMDKVTEQEIQLDLTGISAGMYMLHIVSDEGSGNRKIIKQ